MGSTTRPCTLNEPTPANTDGGSLEIATGGQTRKPRKMRSTTKWHWRIRRPTTSCKTVYTRSLTVEDEVDDIHTSNMSSSDTNDSERDKAEDGGLLPSVGPCEVGDRVYAIMGVDRYEAGHVIERDEVTKSSPAAKKKVRCLLLVSLWHH